MVMRKKMMSRSRESVARLNNDPSVESVWSPTLFPAGYTFSNGNKRVSKPSGSNWYSGYATSRMPITRKSVYEVVFEGVSRNTVVGFSINPTITTYTSGNPGGFAGSGGIKIGQGYNGAVYGSAGVTANVGTFGRDGEFSIGEVIAFLCDPFTGSIYLAKNGILMNSGNPVWTVQANNGIMPAIAFYQSAAATIRSGTGALKYKYGDYSVIDDAGIDPGQGSWFFDSVNKHANIVVYGDNRYITSTATIGAALTSYSTSFVNKPMPGTKKSVFELIIANSLAFSYCGFYFGADRSGPKPGPLGQNIVSSIGIDLYSGGNPIYANGATVNVSTIGAFAENDVLGFGYDPFAKTVVVWKNGVLMNSGNPVWSNVTSLHADGGIMPGVSLNHINGRLRLNPDLPIYDYGDYTS